MNPHPIHTVVIISNNAESTATRELLFRERNCAVLTETSARHAFKTTYLLSPSLLILDLALPHLEQLSLCRELRPVMNGAMLLLSSENDPQMICEYYLAGVDEFLGTPLSPIVLVVKSMAWLMRKDWIDLKSQPSRIYS